MCSFFGSMSGFVTFKDILYLMVGLIMGLLFGVGIYWWPLGQFCNEWKALLNLSRNRYPRDTSLVVKQGTELKPVIPAYPKLLNSDKQMKVWHDEGVNWFHSEKGWLRVRVLQVVDPADERGTLFRICHLDIR